MKTINFGSLKMPLTAATKSFAFLAKRGAGKTYAASVMAEDFAEAGIPFVVFDPIDVWWGLRLAANGKGKGLPVVVFGIEHADIKLDRTMGRRIAEAVVRENISCVISTFGMPKVDQRHIIAEFSETLLNINNTPRHVFIEEAHEYVPQRVQPGAGVVFSRVEALVTMGRNRGIGVSLLNQRAATINKDVLTQIDTLVALRSIGPQDRKALEDWVSAHHMDNMEETDKVLNEFVTSLPSLPTGTAWVWSPEFLNVFEKIKIRKRRTFHPDREKIGLTFSMPKISQVDVKSFVEKFSVKKEDPKKNPAEKIGATIAVNMKKEIDFATRPLLSRIAGLERVIQAQKEDLAAWWKWSEGLTLLWKNPPLKKEHKLFSKGAEIEMVRQNTPQMKISNIKRDEIIKQPASYFASGGEISGPEQRILDAIAWLGSIGNPEPEQVAVAFLAGYTYGGGGFNNPKGSLRSKGLIEYLGDRVKLTVAGGAAARMPAETLTTQDLHRKILERLPGPEQKLLRPLLDNGGEEMSKEELAEISGYKFGTGGFNNPCGRLRTLGLVEYPSAGRVKARSILFI